MFLFVRDIALSTLLSVLFCGNRWSRDTIRGTAQYSGGQGRQAILLRKMRAL